MLLGGAYFAHVPDCRDAIEETFPGVKVNRFAVDITGKYESYGDARIEVSLSAPEDVLIRYGFLTRDLAEKIPACGQYATCSRTINRGKTLTRVAFTLNDTNIDNARFYPDDLASLVFRALTPTIWAPPGGRLAGPARPKGR